MLVFAARADHLDLFDHKPQLEVQRHVAELLKDSGSVHQPQLDLVRARRCSPARRGVGTELWSLLSHLPGGRRASRW